MSLTACIALSAALFAIGVLGVLLKRGALVILMSIELMLNAVNVALGAFARHHGGMDGQILILFVMVVAAAEAIVGLAIILAVYRKRSSTDVDEMTLMRW